MAKLSIIVPVYNVEEFLSECIDSVLKQTFQDWELILVNDGSNDGSKAICDEYVTRDSRIKLIDKHNGGLSSARNAGIEIAQGEYMTFIDSDDVIIGDDTYERLMNTLTADPDLDVVQYDVLFKYLSDDEHCRKYEFKTYTSKEDILRGYLEQQIHVSCCDKIFRASAFKDIRFPIGQISEDIATIPQIIDRINRLKTTAVGYYGYRYREGSITVSVLPYHKILSILKSYHTYLEYAMQYANLKPLVVEMFTNTVWSYASMVRTSYPDKTTDFCKRPHFIHLSIAEWISASKRYSIKQKISSFVSCVIGGKGIFFFQRLFTRNAK